MMHEANARVPHTPCMHIHTRSRTHESTLFIVCSLEWLEFTPFEPLRYGRRAVAEHSRPRYRLQSVRHDLARRVSPQSDHPSGVPWDALELCNVEGYVSDTVKMNAPSNAAMPILTSATIELIDPIRRKCAARALRTTVLMLTVEIEPRSHCWRSRTSSRQARNAPLIRRCAEAVATSP